MTSHRVTTRHGVSRFLTIGSGIVGLLVALASSPTVSAATHSADKYTTTQSRFIINSKTVVRPIILSGSGLGGLNADVPVGSVIRVLRLMNIRSHWNGHTWNLSIRPGIQTSQPTLHIPGSGDVQIQINGQTVANIPHIVYRSDATKPAGTYIPIADVLDVTRWLGFQSYWEGHNWIIFYQAPLPEVTDRVEGKKLTLELKQSPSKMSSSPGGPVVPPVHGTTRISLPLYPSASTTTQKFSLAFAEIPGSWYVRSAKAVYVIPFDVSHAEAWYLMRMGNAGYHQTGSGSTGNFKTGEFVQGYVFQPIHQPNGHQIAVDLSFKTLSSGKTLMEYWATDNVVPPRPTSNFLPIDVKRIAGKMTVYGTKVTQTKVDITNSNRIQTIVKAANSLHNIVEGINPGGPMIWGIAQLTFYTAAGKSISVGVDTNSVNIAGLGLEDYKGVVWAALEKATGIRGPN